MKQSSTTAGRGRKKANNKSSSSSRGSSNSQHRTGGKSSGSSRTSGSTSRSSSSKNTGSRSSGSSNRTAANSRSNAGSSSSSSMRGNSQSATGNRSRSGSQTMGMGMSRGHEQFEGENYLEKFFLVQLQDVYYAEHKITEALPKMMDAATTENLTDAFEDHLHQTQRHIKRLEKVFEYLGKRPEGKKCEAIEGIIREAEQIIDETEEGTLTRDAALIIAAQKVEHYEIATYGGLVQLAITMDLDEAADLLDRTLIEEEDTDALLTDIAENDINLIAEHEGNEYSWEMGLSYESQGGEEEEGEEQGEEEEEGENKSEEAQTSSME